MIIPPIVGYFRIQILTDLKYVLTEGTGHVMQGEAGYVAEIAVWGAWVITIVNLLLLHL